jgi:undecaprenyl-diphosphatase
MAQFKRTAVQVIIATALTGVIGVALKMLIERTVFRGAPDAQIEDLFSHLELIAPALAVGGILILVAGLREGRVTRAAGASADLTTRQASLIGAIQGLCLPFRGFSRSGATISTGMLAGAVKARVEDFSFALAVVLTPAVDARELLRVVEGAQEGGTSALTAIVVPSLVGALCAFLAGLVALKWLSGWLENGRWYLFGIYCLVAAAAVGGLYFAGY